MREDTNHENNVDGVDNFWTFENQTRNVPAIGFTTNGLSCGAVNSRVAVALTVRNG